MYIAGLQKITLVDYPGKIAATVFTRGCSFRCSFCHNPELVLPEKYNPIIEEEEFFDFLKKRQGKIQGVCITGGEPLLHKDIEEFIDKIKTFGYTIKLDTNGSFPDRLEALIRYKKIDYIAMDIKSSLEKYAETSNYLITTQNQKNTKSEEINKLVENIRRSIGLIMDSGIDYEFRTTVCHPYHKIEDFISIGKTIEGAKKYYIQNFVKSKHVNNKIDHQPFSDDELESALDLVSKYVLKAEIR